MPRAGNAWSDLQTLAGPQAFALCLPSSQRESTGPESQLPRRQTVQEAQVSTARPYTHTRVGKRSLRELLRECVRSLACPPPNQPSLPLDLLP